MNNDFKNSGSADVIITVIMLIIIAFGATFIFTPLMIVYPLPVIILSGRRGFKYSIFALAGADIIVVAALGPVLGAVFAVMMTSLAVVVSWCLHNKERPSYTMGYGAIAFMVSFALIILMLKAFAGINFITVMTDMLDTGYDVYTEMASEAGQSDQMQKTLEYMKEAVESSKEFIRSFFPSMLICTSLIFSSVNYLIAAKLRNKFKFSIEQANEMRFFTFPKSFIVSMALLLLASYGLKLFNMKYAAVQINLLFLCYIGMFVQGLAVLKFFLKIWRVPRSGRGIVIALALIISPIVQLLTIVGMIDMIFDLRKLRVKV